MRIPDDPSRPILSVVMPTRGRRARLPEVLAPLLDDPLISEIVVVVDGSYDGSVEWLRDRAVDEPRLVPLSRERSGGAQVARAEGVARVTGDVVLFLDDDVIADADLAAGHLARHESGEGMVVVGFMPVALPEHRRPGQFASYLYADEYLKRCADYEDHPEQILRTLWWGNVSMRRADAVAVGLVSDGFGDFYHEDKDFGLRCLAFGLRGVFDRTLRAQHLHARDIDAFIRDARSQGAGRVMLHRHHPDLIGDLDPADFADGLPLPAELLVRGAGSPAVASASTAVLRTVAEASGRMGWYGIETLAGKILRRVNQRAGAESVWRNEAAPTRRAETSGRP